MRRRYDPELQHELGALCSIWDGEGPIDRPSSWPIGIIVQVTNIKRRPEHRRYRVLWSDGLDRTAYAASDIDLGDRPEQ